MEWLSTAERNWRNGKVQNSADNFIKLVRFPSFMSEMNTRLAQPELDERVTEACISAEVSIQKRLGDWANGYLRHAIDWLNFANAGGDPLYSKACNIYRERREQLVQLARETRTVVDLPAY
jgi:hypothetical protein